MLKNGLALLIHNWCKFCQFCQSRLPALTELLSITALYINMEKRYFTVKEIASYLGMSPNTIRAWIRVRQIPYLKLGRAVRFDIRKIDIWAESKNRSLNSLDFHLRRV